MTIRYCIGVAILAGWILSVPLLDVPLWGSLIGGIVVGHFVGAVVWRWQ